MVSVYGAYAILYPNMTVDIPMDKIKTNKNND